MTTPEPAPGSLRTRRWLELLRGYAASWVTGLLSLLVCTVLVQLHHQYESERERQQVEARLSLLRARLEATAQASFNATQSLEAMIQLDGELSEERFQALTRRVVRLSLIHI